MDPNNEPTDLKGAPQPADADVDPRQWLEQGFHLFGDVFEAELDEIALRRRLNTPAREREAEAESSSPTRENLVGLALSGGGIRSATFCLGLLQRLNDLGLLRAFDYLSTVSGGGYVGGWWSAWLAREGMDSQRKDTLRVAGDDDPDRRWRSRAHFLERDISDPEGLLRRLVAPDNENVAAIRRSLTQGSRRLIRRSRERSLLAVPPPKLREDLRRSLRKVLNQLLGSDRLLLEGVEIERMEMRPDLDRYHASEDPLTDRAKLNRLILETVFEQEINRGLFPDCEEIEPNRAEDYLFRRIVNDHADRVDEGTGRRLRSMLVEGAFSAGRDPIHHLRQFANYLTPRKGALSSDAWRAVAVVTRNLALTWIILIPILVAIMLIAQLYFIAHPASNADFPHHRLDTVALSFASAKPPPATIIAKHVITTFTDSLSGRADTVPGPLEFEHAMPLAALGTVGNGFRFAPHGAHTISTPEVMFGRVEAILWLLVPLFGWILVVTAAWLISGNTMEGRNMRERVRVVLWPVAIVLMIGLALTQSLVGSGAEAGLLMRSAGWWWGSGAGGFTGLGLWCAVACGLVAWGYRTKIADGGTSDREHLTRSQWRKEVRRNRLTRLHARLLSLTAVLALVMLLAGFGHEAIDYLLVDPNAQWGLFAYVSRAGGWGAVLVAIAGAIYTAMKNLPAGGGELLKKARASRLTRAAFAVVPPLLVLVLAFTAAWIAHQGLMLLFDRIVRHPAGNVLVDSGLMTSLTAAKDIAPAGVKAVLFGTALAFGGSAGAAPVAATPYYLLHILLLTGVVICFTFVLQEKEFRFPRLGIVLNLIVLLIFMWNGWRFVWGVGPVPFPREPGVLIITAAITGGLLLVLVLTRGRFIGSHAAGDSHATGAAAAGGAATGDAASTHAGRSGAGRPSIAAGARWVANALVSVIARRSGSRAQSLAAGLALAALICVCAFGAALLAGGLSVITTWSWVPLASNSSGYAFYGFICALMWASAKMFVGVDRGNRSLLLVFAEYLVLAAYMGTMLVMDAHPASAAAAQAHIAVCMIGTVLAWSVVLGWIADPNPLSMHEFYKARLTRAYLGASNPQRRHGEREITEAAEGDDLLMQDLKNCRRGAPYHLINTTLNLAGGSDLTVSQRIAAGFLISKLYCGSTRTGYRRSNQYMNGRMTLGTAVAISGAAASPTMGNKTPSAALSMLMTLFNVRLGYWAPTPNLEDWQLPQARLWPFYVMREFLSQTNDLSSFCYLTDGGHFDNTGLYSLVERGCRYIVVADCGADPDRTFSDLGDAVRRCRIDFRAEFDLDVSPLVVSPEEARKGKLPAVNFVVGTVTYAKEHLNRLHWGSHTRTAEARTGIIIVIKPTLTAQATLDVEQYGATYEGFPQQAGDQWFDEAQFESYRRLGVGAVDAVVDYLREKAASDSPGAAALATVVDSLVEEQTIGLRDVPRFFEGAYAVRPGLG